ncbi:hypothetical protein ACIBL8_46830 [Streptomyces sp. NPDC050523]|uniref:hypothetical protein n=1 Tax=Streptomyces sp. NPDC050523 TaxID=3365622 RepID=UPI0037A534D9
MSRRASSAARFVLLAAARSNLAELLVAKGVLGFGVGSFSAAMPGLILAVTPKSETSGAMSFNYLVRSVGYALGGAIGGLVLATGTDTGHLELVIDEDAIRRLLAPPLCGAPGRPSGVCVGEGDYAVAALGG